MKKIFILLLGIFITAGVTACDIDEIIDTVLDFISPGDNDNPFEELPTELDNFFGDRVSFADTHTPVVRDENGYIAGCFRSDMVAGVSLTHVVDGDTADFIDSTGFEFRVRFLLIDAPEMSTTLGDPARDFAINALYYAEAIIIDGIDAAHSSMGRTDIFNRWLGLVWFVPQGGNPQNLEEFRLFQLEIVESALAWHPGWGSMSQQHRRFVLHTNRNEDLYLYNYFADQLGSLCIRDVVNMAYRRTRTLGQLVSSPGFIANGRRG